MNAKIDYEKLGEEALPVAKAMLESYIKTAGPGASSYGHLAMALAMLVRTLTDTHAAVSGRDSGRDASLRVCEGVRVILDGFPEGIEASMPGPSQ